jgi:3-oxoacyl-[acyl-carrier protein] reductase
LVGVHYRTRLADADSTVAAIQQGGGEGFALQADLRRADETDAMFAQFLSRSSRLDVLVCNAGTAASGLLLRLSDSRWQEVIDTNLTGTFHCLRAVGPTLLKQQAGSVVIVSSFAAQQGRPGQASYAASKAGLLGLMKSAAREWGRSNVRVNAVFPGWHRTGMAETVMPAADNLEDHALGKSPDLEEVADAVVYLALLKGASGQVWNLDSRIF